MIAAASILATGARTPLGLQSAPAAAAIRAGISATREHPFMIDQAGEPMPAALDLELDPGMKGPARLLAIAESALREACAPLEAAGRGIRLRVPLHLGLPEIRPGFTQQDAATIQSGLAKLKEVPVDFSSVNVCTEGHAAGLRALANATAQIQQGACEACLIGGVDSYLHPDTMEWLDENRQLAGTVSRSSFVPGEGAAFCLLLTERAWKRLGLVPLAQVRRVAVGQEAKRIKTSEACLGEALTATIREALSRNHPSVPETVNAVFCDINGERYRGEEWGFACLRLAQYFDDPTGYVAPADCWGDMGAASGPLFVMLACQAAARGYAAGPRTLVWASSESGLRGAAMLETTTKM